MVLLDDRILELLSEEGPRSPKEIADDTRIPYGNTYVGQRCRKLRDHGLTRSVGRGTYLITDLGEQYLRGEAPLDELGEPPEADDREGTES
jgi:predicted transcriptional regulator